MSIVFHKRMLTAACLAASLAVVGCSALPHEGPSRSQVEQAHQNNNSSGFVLIDVNQNVANYLAGVNEQTLGDRFGKGKPALVSRIGVGDVLAVQIWEADPGGLFGSSGLVNRGEIPKVVVDSRGTIKIPYAGTIQARGRTPAQVADAITRRLQTKTVEPQVHVAVAKNIANVTTVTGHVGQPGIYPLSMRGDTLLDVIATSGGSRAPAYETMVRFTRGNRTAVTYLDQVIETRSSNLYIQPGDKIHVESRPKSFAAFGAVTSKGKRDFGSSKLTVLEAVAESRGLSDQRADPTGVFVMRFEDRERAFDLAGSEVPNDALPVVPVIYRFDLQDPNQYFFAQSINMRDKDIIYVANAPAVEVDKFLSIVGKGVGTASASTSFYNRLN